MFLQYWRRTLLTLFILCSGTIELNAALNCANSCLEHEAFSQREKDDDPESKANPGLDVAEFNLLFVLIAPKILLILGAPENLASSGTRNLGLEFVARGPPSFQA